MVMMVQYFDALRDIGTTGQNNAVLIPYGAGGSNEIMQQMTQALVTSDLINKKKHSNSETTATNENQKDNS